MFWLMVIQNCPMQEWMKLSVGCYTGIKCSGVNTVMVLTFFYNLYSNDCIVSLQNIGKLTCRCWKFLIV
jgi:hypothetical protein